MRKGINSAMYLWTLFHNGDVLKFRFPIRKANMLKSIINYQAVVVIYFVFSGFQMVTEDCNNNLHVEHVQFNTTEIRHYHILEQPIHQ